MNSNPLTQLGKMKDNRKPHGPPTTDLTRHLPRSAATKTSSNHRGHEGTRFERRGHPRRTCVLVSACLASLAVCLATDRVIITSTQTITESDTTDDGADLVIDGPITVAPGECLRVNLRGLAASGVNELYVSQGSIPTRQQSDSRSTATSQDQQIILSDPALATPRGGFGMLPGVSDIVQVLGLGSSSMVRIVRRLWSHSVRVASRFRRHGVC